MKEKRYLVPTPSVQVFVGLTKFKLFKSLGMDENKKKKMGGKAWGTH